MPFTTDLIENPDALPGTLVSTNQKKRFTVKVDSEMYELAGISA